MIAQFIFSILLAGIVIYAWSEYARSPAVAVLTLLVASAGLYFVWMPEHSTQLAEAVGIGRGVDLILYIWVCLSLIVLLNLHLKLRTQMELITALARKNALADARPARVQAEQRDASSAFGATAVGAEPPTSSWPHRA
jgi:small membrane protein